MKQQSKNWKEVLCLLTDGVVICDHSKVLFKNSAMDSFFTADSRPGPSDQTEVLSSVIVRN